MATTGGATAAGAADLGTIAVGTRADLVVLDPSSPSLTPSYDAHSTAAYAASRADVRWVVAAGRVVVDDRHLVTIDVDGAVDCAARAGAADPRRDRPLTRRGRSAADRTAGRLWGDRGRELVNRPATIAETEIPEKGEAMIRSKRLLAVGLVAALGLVAAACGDDDDSGSSATTAGRRGADHGGRGGDHDRRRRRRRPRRPKGGSSDSTAPEGSLAPAVENPKVGLLYDITGRGDRSFNDAAAAGLDEAKASVGAVGTESTPSSDGDRAERLAGLEASGQDYIIGVGFLWGNAIQEAAVDEPGPEVRPASTPSPSTPRARPTTRPTTSC